MYRELLRIVRHRVKVVDVRRPAAAERVHYSVRDARDNFSRLLDRVLDGETIVVTRAGRPIVKLVPADDGDIPVPGVVRARIFLETPPVRRGPA